MAPTHPLGSRRPDPTGRRLGRRWGMALSTALLLGGVTLMVIATVMLLVNSSARKQATMAQQRYFTPATELALGTSTSLRDRVSDLPRPVATPAGVTKPTVGRRSPTASGTARTDSAGPGRSVRASPALTPSSIPTSIELAGSHNPIRVVPIAVSAAGVLEPPSDISTAGWWVSGPRPGAAGRAIITGHIDSTAGLGAFAALDLLQVGDAISLHEANGRTMHFKVTVRQEVEKTQLDPRLLQHSTNVSDLLLVTCIGNFDDSTHSYDSNLLVTAVPVSQ